MALKNFTQFTPQTVLSATDYLVGYRDLDEIRTDLSSPTDAISGLLISKGFTPGGTVGSVKRVGFRFTIASGNNLNAVSGFDDFGSFLLYNAGAVEVLRRRWPLLVQIAEALARSECSARCLSIKCRPRIALLPDRKSVV